MKDAKGFQSEKAVGSKIKDGNQIDPKKDKDKNCSKPLRLSSRSWFSRRMNEVITFEVSRLKLCAPNEPFG